MKQPQKVSFKRRYEAEKQRADLLLIEVHNAKAALGLVAKGGLDTDPKTIKWWAGELVKNINETLAKVEVKPDERPTQED
ncbi:hypothetical protein [Vibrio phage VP16T]|nr:hypothetical protein [Vibrio phage VP16T]